MDDLEVQEGQKFHVLKWPPQMIENRYSLPAPFNKYQSVIDHTDKRITKKLQTIKKQELQKDTEKNAELFD